MKPSKLCNCALWDTAVGHKARRRSRKTPATEAARQSFCGYKPGITKKKKKQVALETVEAFRYLPREGRIKVAEERAGFKCHENTEKAIKNLMTSRERIK